MKKTAEAVSGQSKRVSPWVYVAVLMVNVMIFACIGAVYFASERFYGERLYQENIHNVESLNTASANAAYTYTNGMGVKIDDMIRYIEARGLTYEETIQYLCDANTDPDRQIQLVLSGTYGASGALSFGDYSGVSFRVTEKDDGTLEAIRTPIQYGSGYYDIFRSFTDVNDENFHGVCFAPEFTDPDTKRKCFAVYQHTVLTDAAGQKALYTVLLAIHSQTALDAYNMQNEYAGQATVLVNADGDYIIKNSDYRNVNFFDYIINYNGLTLDRKDQIRDSLSAGTRELGSSVNLFYQNHQGEDCVFSVTAIENGWYSITCVPLSSFRVEDDAVNYSLIILLLFLVLFVIDGCAIFFIGRIMSYNITVAEQATRAANEANKAKSRFLSTMSHELRTPLNAIIGLVSLSGDSIGDPPVLRDYLKKIDVSSRLLLQLISDILDVSAIESNKMKLNNSEFDISKLITSLSAIYYDQCAAKGIEFHVALRNMHSDTLIGDSVRVNQVLLNFLSNAVKFTPAGGTVTLSAEQTAREADAVVIRFSVSDTGCGVSEELKTRLFRPFEREGGDASRRYSGTGLGLSIAKNLVELMHGQVGMDSREGEGSCFYAEIPFGIPVEKTERSFSPIENLRVLAAVSDSDERGYVGQILSGFGVERTMAATAKEALALLEERCGGDRPYNMLILDWKMPDLSGTDAARRVCSDSRYKDLRVMVLAYDLAEASARCAAAGADLVLGKPVFPSALYNVLEEISSDAVRVIPVSKETGNLSGKRVLLVEDNRMNTEIARLLLRKFGVETETADNGQRGLDAFAASPKGYFDAILMDVQMPVMDGYQATEAIRKSAHPQAKTIPILAMTADAFAEDVEKARRAGMNEHISKPVVPENLYRILKKHLD